MSNDELKMPNELSDLMSRWWKREDLGDLDLIEKGLKFAKHYWNMNVWGFETRQAGNGGAPPQPQKVTELARHLIEYYSRIVYVE